MNDWISRKDAINIIQSWLDSDIGYSEGERNVMGCAIEELKNLPPAKCLANDRYAEGLRDGAIIERKVTERWISVKDWLPEENGRYLAYIVNRYVNGIRYIMTAEYFSKTKEWVVDDDCSDNNVVAWQPLPNPPKVGDEE